MATGAVPTSFTGLKGRDTALGFTKSLDFVRVSDLKRFKSGRTRISVIRNSNPGSDIAELKPASEGSPLLGDQIPHDQFLLFSLCFNACCCVLILETISGS